MVGAGLSSPEEDGFSMVLVGLGELPALGTWCYALGGGLRAQGCWCCVLAMPGFGRKHLNSSPPDLKYANEIALSEPKSGGVLGNWI